MNKILITLTALFATFTVACSAPVQEDAGTEQEPAARTDCDPDPDPDPVVEPPVIELVKFDRSQSFVFLGETGEPESCVDVRVFADEGTEELEQAKLLVESLDKTGVRIEQSCRQSSSLVIQASCQSQEPVPFTVQDTWYYRFANTREDVQSCHQVSGEFRLP